MKKNYFLRIAAVLLVGVLFGLCIIPGTMSRYGDSFTINSATVRAGIFEVAILRGNLTNGQPNWVSIVQGTTGQAIEINLYDTLKQADLTKNQPVGMDGDEIEDGEGFIAYIKDELEGLIAPGCGGTFNLSVKNFSEVKVKLSVTAKNGGNLLVTGGDMHKMIQWLDNGAWVDTFPGVSGGSAVELDPIGAEDSIWSETFTWRWLFERATDESGAFQTPYDYDGLDQVDPALGGYEDLLALGDPLADGWRNISDVADTNLGRGGLTGDEITTLMLSLDIDVEQVD